MPSSSECSIAYALMLETYHCRRLLTAISEIQMYHCQCIPAANVLVSIPARTEFTRGFQQQLQWIFMCFCQHLLAANAT